MSEDAAEEGDYRAITSLLASDEAADDRRTRPIVGSAIESGVAGGCTDGHVETPCCPGTTQ